MGKVVRVKYLVVGSGANGISPAVLLMRRGVTDIRIISRHSDFGGVWHENRYPGCITDVPVLAYQFSWDISYDWTSSYASRAEMAAYLQRSARKNGLYEITDFNTELLEAEWVEEEGVWKVSTNNGDYFAEFLLLSTGFLDDKLIPKIDGIDEFKGRLFHSSVWPEDYTGEGDVVAVMGTSSSGVQIVPEMQKIAKQVYVFQRTPAYIFPLEREFYTPEQIEQHRANPALEDQKRKEMLKYYNGRVVASHGKNPEVAEASAERARLHRERSVPDLELRAKLTPSYPLNCKRPTNNDLYYPSLQQPNVELITEAATGLHEHSIYTASGREFQVDTVVMATGFNWGGDILHKIRRRDGRTVAEHQKGHRRAYKSISVSECPNLFLIGGAGANGAHWNGYINGEFVPRYIARVTEYMEKHGIAAMEVTEEAETEWKRNSDLYIANAPSLTGGCSNYALDETGHDMTYFPGSPSDMEKAMDEFIAEDYQVVPVPHHQKSGAQEPAVSDHA